MTGNADDESAGSLRGKRIWVAGHRGMVGSAILRRLQREDCTVLYASKEELDLRDQHDTERWVYRNRPDVAIIAAARVGGIMANAQFPVDFLHDNLAIALNTMHAAHGAGVERLLWLASSCIYPKHADQPLTESALLTGPLEPTNEAYAVAKIAGLKLAEAYARQYGLRYFTAMPTNLYGPNDNFDPQTAHVLPATIRKIHEAKLSGARTVAVWGTGTPLREFLHVDDLADAVIFLLERYEEGGHINIGSGQEISIASLNRLVADIVGYDGDFVFDTSKPDGTPRKSLDMGRLAALGWQPRRSLEEGIRELYELWKSGTQVAERPLRLAG